jgi:hypothetical protein
VLYTGASVKNKDNKTHYVPIAKQVFYHLLSPDDTVFMQVIKPEWKEAALSGKSLRYLLVKVDQKPQAF